MTHGGRPLTVHCAGPDRMERGDESPLDRRGSGITVVLATLNELREQAPAYRALLDPLETERATRFKFETDRERYLLGHGLMRMLLGERTGRPPGSLDLLRGPFGKPFLAETDIAFNLSDTKDAVALAMGVGIDLGLDLETMGRKVDHMAVGEHYFTPEERIAISASQDPKRCFLDFWTRKEAVLKASGVGIMDDLRVLQVNAEVNPTVISHAMFIRMAAPVYHVHTWHVGDDHIISLASSQPFSKVRIVRPF